MSSNDLASTETSVRVEVRPREAYERVRREIAALSAEKVVQVNVDIRNATAIAFGAKARLQALKQVLQQHLRKHDPGIVDRMEVYGCALLHAHSVFEKKTTRPYEDLRRAADQGNDVRQVLRADCRSLIDRKLISANALDGYNGLIGHKIIGSDLELLCDLLSANWEHIEGRCATTRAELEHARRLASRIVQLRAKRDQAAAHIAKAADNRARAFTLFINCYDEIRRGVSFVRWHEGDADEIAPSLYVVRKRREEAPAPSPSGRGLGRGSEQERKVSNESGFMA